MEEEEEAANLQRFLQWATHLGISDSPYVNQSNNPTRSGSCLGHSLSVSYFPNAGGRGLSAVRDLRKGELILKVPKSALMTTETLMKDHRLSVSAPKHSLSSTEILTVALLNEMAKGKTSWWYPYLMQLPRSYDTIASFGQFEIQAFQLDDAIWSAEKAVGKAELEWKNATALMEELMLKPQYMNFKAWLWASATISSRTMHVPWDAAGCLCPVGDFFNYAAPGEEQVLSEDLRTGDPTVKLEVEQLDVNILRLTDGVYEEDAGAYCFYARKVYRKGEQVLLSYGTYTNVELLEHYGFLLNENPNDKAFIPLAPDIYSLCSWPMDSLYIDQNGKPSFALLSAMRLWATPPNQRKSVGQLAYSGSAISTTNEIIMMEHIAKNCLLVLKNLPTSIEEDKLLLCTIDKMHDICAAMEFNTMLPTFEGETRKFLEVNGLVKEGNSGKVNLSRKAIRSMGRWKLAVQCRLKYKAILEDCISYCKRVIDYISSQDNSIRRTEIL